MKQNMKLKLDSDYPEMEGVLKGSGRVRLVPSSSRMRQRIKRIKSLLQGALASYPPSPDKAFKRLQAIFDELEFLEKAVEDNHQQTKTSKRQNSLTNQHLHYLAFHDPLTKIPNRRYFKAAVEKLMTEEKSRKSFHIAFVDLDSFKAVNDLYGHEMGDWLLTQVARRLQYCLRKTDLICRYGGDEFVLALQHCPEQEDLIYILNRILSHLTQPYGRGDVQVHIGASIGVVNFTPEITCVDDLIHKADVAMYQAKLQGKNRFCFWHKDKREHTECP